MRITTGMMKMAHRRSGSTQKGSSLLNYVGKKGAATSRLNTMNASAASVRSARMEKGNYEKLEKSADGLTSAISALTAKVDSGSENLVSEAASMVEKFNETLRNLRNASGVLNQFYHQSMKDLSETNKNELGEIGITVAADGSLTLNKEKLVSADREQVGKLLGSKGDFAQRAGLVASRAADNAGVNAESVSSRYDSRGSIASSYLNKYNFWS